jgi:predicted nucleic acid-binding Zn ribbon protein
MLFGYECQKCSKRFDADFPIGTAPRSTRCPTCKGLGKRVYEGTSIAIKIGGHTSLSSNFGEQMKKKNTDAAHRMKGRTAPKLVGYDYGGGKVVETK